MTKEEFVKKIYAAAVRIGEIDPLFVTAQAALESGWGANAIGTYNIFGITKGSWTGDTELVPTTEYFNRPDITFKSPECVLSVEKVGSNRYKYKVKRLFRKYNSYDECLADHLAILKKPGYADAWEYRKDPYKFAEKISDHVGARYATATDYVKVMHSMINSVKRRL